MGRPTVVHVSPHPDDESIGAPCTLLALQEAGWHVVNLACSLGRPGDHERRRVELAAALKVAEFDGVVPDPPIALSQGSAAHPAVLRVETELRALVGRTGARLVVGPHPRDGHHGHATVAKAVRRVVRRAGGDLTWWMWSIWADLPRPTLAVNCPDGLLDISERMLAEHSGENGRNDYLAMHRPIRRVNAVRGAEKAVGFGSAPGRSLDLADHVELLTEVTFRDRKWLVGAPRLLDPRHPLSDEGWTELDDWSLMSSTRLRPLYRFGLRVTDTYQRFAGRPIRY